MNTFHIRFTPHDLSGYQFDWLDEYPKYMLFQETRDKSGATVPLHYHIYVESENGKQSIVNDIKSSLKIPPTGRGKNNKYYSCIPDWQDSSYVAKWGNEVKTKGFSEAAILERVVSGRKKYIHLVEKTELSGDCVAPAVLPAKKKSSESFQQKVIAIASAEWYKYKKDNVVDFVNSDGRHQLTREAVKAVIGFVTSGMREVSRGINPYMVRDLTYAVLHDDLDYREWILDKIISKADLL